MSRILFPESFTERIDRLRRISMGAAGEVMPTLEKLAWQDNQSGLLAGLDRDGLRMAPLAASTIRRRRSATGRAQPTAPPLIPARKQSRAIANYRVTSFPRADGNWVILGAWVNVLSKKGIPFLGFHADGIPGRLPARDIFGVRPEGRRKIAGALREWLLSKWGE